MDEVSRKRWNKKWKKHAHEEGFIKLGIPLSILQQVLSYSIAGYQLRAREIMGKKVKEHTICFQKGEEICWIRKVEAEDGIPQGWRYMDFWMGKDFSFFRPYLFSMQTLMERFDFDGIIHEMNQK